MHPLADLLTLFTTCKPFVGENAVMQENAFATWKDLDVPLVILGSEVGVLEHADRYGATNVRDVRYHDSGMPYVDEIFTRAQALAQTPFCCYINSDILLPSRAQKVIYDFLSSVEKNSRFLLTARRKNIPLNKPLPVSREERTAFLETVEVQSGSWDKSSAIDIFIFPTGMFLDVPPFLFGRMQWDNWLLWKAKEMGGVIIDASYDMNLLHPIHGYAGDGTSWLVRAQGLDAMKNRELAGQNLLAIKDACSHFLRNGKLVEIDGEAHQELEVYCSSDPVKEFSAGIQCLCETCHTMTEEQVIDFCRTLLWRAGYFFPTLIGAVPPRGDFESAMTLIASTRDDTEKASVLQMLVTYDFRRILKKEYDAKRPIYIWGAGEAGHILLDFMSSLQIVPAGILDSNTALKGSFIGNLNILHPDDAIGQPSDTSKPFILLASMYAQEISLLLETKGYIFKQDYLG